MNRYVEYFLYPYIVMFQSLPKVALAPLIVIWFGLGLTSKVVNAALVAFFPLLVNTMVGLRSADEDRVSLMRSLHASETQIFWMLRLPNALPFVMAGLDIAMILALIGAIVAEFAGATSGLGTLILSMTYTMDVSGQFSVLLILSVVGLVLNRLVHLVRRRVLFWDPSEKGVEAPEARRWREPRSPLPTRIRRPSYEMAPRLCWPSPAPSRCAPRRRADHQAPDRHLRPHDHRRSRRAVRGRHQDGLVQGGRDRGGARAAAGLDRLREDVATKEVPVALPSVEPLAILRPQGVKAKFFYTAYQTNTYGIAVPADSPIQKLTDLKGKTIGVTNMSSAGVIIARAQAAAAGLNPDTDITIVVAGEGAQPAIMLKNKQVDALSQFDTQYALIEIAGVKLRLLDTSAIARHPANGFIALEETIKNSARS